MLRKLRRKKIYFEKSEVEEVKVNSKKEVDWVVVILIGALIGFTLSTGYYRYELRQPEKPRQCNPELGF